MGAIQYTVLIDNGKMESETGQKNPVAINTIVNVASWSRSEISLYILLLATALVLRLWDLGYQALHHDESLHAVYSWYLYSANGYTHDPMMHGPFQFLGTAAIFLVLWDSDFTVRLLPVLFGTFLVATPILLRHFLGRSGALFTALLLCISPTTLYFSRFARNDVYMAVWTMLLVAFIWRYIESGKNRYLVLLAATLSLAFSTKESTFIIVFVFSSYLLVSAYKDIGPWLIGRKHLKNFSRHGSLLVLLACLSLPFAGAGIAIIQGSIGLTLANSDYNLGPHGIPLGSSLFVAFFTVSAFTLISLFIGFKWNPNGARAWIQISIVLITILALTSALIDLIFEASLIKYSIPAGLLGAAIAAIIVGVRQRGWWLLSLGVFLSIWILTHTTFLTNPEGVSTGFWQSLGYWVVQQGVARGDQPWYYYLIIGLNYEFLAAIFGGIGIYSFLTKGNKFSVFLVYWACTNLLIYTYASEKMPWLLFNITLPFLLISGKVMGDLWNKLPWCKNEVENEVALLQERNTLFTNVIKIAHWNSILFTICLIATLLSFGWIIQNHMFANVELNIRTAGIWASALGLLLISSYLLVNAPTDKRRPLFLLSLAATLCILTVVSSFRLTYKHSDIPVEMLIYTQTSPDIPKIMHEIERLGKTTGEGNNLVVTVDSSDGYTWPWAWYLRNYPNASYPCLGTDDGCGADKLPNNSDILLLSASNQYTVNTGTIDFAEPKPYKHRWWFPEYDTYRELTIPKIVEGIDSKQSWCRVFGYFWNRHLPHSLGTSNAYAYFPSSFDLREINTNTIPSQIC
ncbi:TIGR03663 family protein [SAR202 cluster bacterium AD-493-K16_JPT_193m]|nr:TIGR03663 family protein [SAR202 cluster bacterium AD-493-K16_JPT_193m]